MRARGTVWEAKEIRVDCVIGREAEELLAIDGLRWAWHRRTTSAPIRIEMERGRCAVARKIKGWRRCRCCALRGLWHGWDGRRFELTTTVASLQITASGQPRGWPPSNIQSAPETSSTRAKHERSGYVLVRHARLDAWSSLNAPLPGLRDVVHDQRIWEEIRQWLGYTCSCCHECQRARYDESTRTQGVYKARAVSPCLAHGDTVRRRPGLRKPRSCTPKQKPRALRSYGHGAAVADTLKCPGH